MIVVNVHQRELPVPRARAGALIDTLASPADRLWPHRSWPRMTLDRPLAVGAAGGHGPIGYVVESHEPGRRVVFRFTRPRGFDGTHRLEALDLSQAGGVSGAGDVPRVDEPRSVLRHTLEMDARGPARLTWPLLFRPLHDALIEDALATAEAALGLPPDVRGWSPWVRALRRVLSRGRARPQEIRGGSF